ncbi:MAG: transcriptional regulator PpsR [Deltaproteobacteria bacterium]|nr:transcriptional regulator PpsR [Nannocystaceae bacterium]
MTPSSPAAPTSVLDAAANPLAVRLVESLSDLALLVDADGVIVEVAVGNGMAADPGLQAMLNRRWVDVAGPESRGKIEQLLQGARALQPTRAREINFKTDELGELPFRFTCALVDNEHVLAFGIDIRQVAAMQQRLVNAQQAMETEHERVRQAEAQYRVLFHVSSEGVLITRGPGHLVSEANPAALALFGASAESLRDKPVRSLLSDDSSEVYAELLASSSAAKPSEVAVRLAHRPELEVTSTAVAFRQAGAAVTLFRFWPTRRAAAADADADRVREVVEAMPDAFVVTDEDLRVVSANASFCELVERASEAQVIGVPVERWLGAGGVDVNIITAALRERGVIRNFSSTVRSEFGAEIATTVTAVSAPAGEAMVYGFMMRPSRPPVRTHLSLVPSRSTQEIQDLVGRMSLKEIVQESADLIERLCIEAALDISGNNRAAAAKLLKLSRQSLYTKLRGHGLEAAAPPESDSSEDA